MSDDYQAWREQIKRDGTPDPPVIFAGNWARKYIEDLEADAARGRALVEYMFSLTRPSPAWEQALAELRVWSMAGASPRQEVPNTNEETR